MQSITLKSSDGAAIAARVYEPETLLEGNVVIGGAMGVRQSYYEPFAEWLASQGWRVTTFDYRGSGDSAPPNLKGFQADLFDWTRDYEAAIDHAHDALPGAPLYLVGHSLGAEGAEVADAENAPKLKRIVPYFWFVLVPIATKLFGYFPGRKLRKVGDLPAGVIMQWRKWCLNPRYSVGAEGEAVRRSYANVRFPVLALSISDDELMTLQGTRSLFDLYVNAPRQIERIAPAELALRRIGHFGPFRAEQETRLWPRMATWLRDMAAPASIAA
jgi:predicted alpha/beta hydrolase